MAKLLSECFAVGAGGCVGAVARFLLDRATHWLMPIAFPIGTLIVNISGCLLLGWFLGGHGQPRADQHIPYLTRLTFATGFVGAYTTFSTFAYQSNELLAQGATWRAGLNLFGSLVLGLLAVRAGIWLATP